MKKIGKKVLAMVSTAAMLAGLFSVGGTNGKVQAAPDVVYDAASAVNFSTILGRAVDFGITANYMEQANHMETPVAVNTFKNSGANNDVDLAGSQPAHFLIASVEGDSKVVLGKAYSDGMIYNIETTADVRSKVEKHSTCNAQIIYKIADEATIRGNINSIIQRMKDESAKLAGKTTLDLTGRYDFNGDKYDINLTDEQFKGKTVYIDATNNPQLAEAASRTESLNIRKWSDTVVVFNMPESNTNYYDWQTNTTTPKMFINKYTVQVWDGENLGEKIKSGDQTHSGNDSQHNIDIDSEIAQKIVFNLPDSTDITIDNTAGVFLIPQATSNTSVGSSAGWMVSAGNVKNHAEWHFIYHGRSHDVNDGEKIGQMHFAARKAFYQTTTDGAPNEIYTVSAKEGDFSFALYNSDASYAVGTKIASVANDSNSKIKFPVMTFDSDGTYYYVIKEDGAGTVNNGIKKSDGEIDIKMVVTSEEAYQDANPITIRRFKITSYHYLTAADKAAGKAFKINNEIDMSDVEFSLGGFYNKVVEGEGKLSISKKVTGATVPSSKTFKIAVKNADGIYITDTNGKLGTKTPYYFTFKAGDKKIIDKLPVGTYTVEEDKEDAAVEERTLTVTGDGDYEVEADKTKDCIVTNTYKDVDRGSLKITKIVKKPNEGMEGTDYTIPVSFKVAVKDSEGRYVQDVNGTLAADKYYFDIENSKNVTITKLPVGTYYVEEDEDPANADARITLDVSGNGAVDVVADSVKDVSLTNTYTFPHIPAGDLTVTKSQAAGSIAIPADVTFPISIRFDHDLSCIYKGETITFKAGTAQIFNVKKGESIELKDIPYAFNSKQVKYTVEETLTGEEYTHYGTPAITYSNSDHYVVKDNTVTVDVANTLKSGSLKITKKKATGSQTFETGKKFKVNVKFDTAGTYKVGGVATSFTTAAKEFSIGENESITITDIPEGVKYTVSEDLSGTTYAGYSLDEITYDNNTKAIRGGQTDNATVNNTYEKPKPKTGTLEVKKVKSGASDAIAADKTFPISVKFSVAGDYKVRIGTGTQTGESFAANTPKVFNLKIDDILYIGDVPEGATYVVAEDILGIADYNGYSTPVITYSNSKKEIVADQAVTATVSNTYENEEVGKLIIEKTIEGDITEAEIAGELKFDVTDPDGKTTTYTIGSGFAKIADGKYRLTIDPAKAGSYTILEKTKDFAGRDVAVSYSASAKKPGSYKNYANKTGKEATYNLEEGYTLTVSCKDTYTSKKAKLKVIKVVEGIDAADKDATKNYSFTVKNVAGKYINNLGNAQDAQYTFAALKENTPVTIENLPLGKYTVTEIIDGDAVTVANYDFDESRSTITGIANLETEGETKEVTLTNTYKKTAPDKGSLALTKTISGATESEAKNAIVFKITGPDGYSKTVALKSTDFKRTAANTFKLTLTELTIGDYDIEETSYDLSGHAVVVKYKVGTGAETEGKKATAAVAKDATTEVAFSDTYTKAAKANLAIKKTVSGTEAADANVTNKVFKFTVKNSANKYISEVGAIVDDEETISVKANETKTITDLPLDTYTVTEISDSNSVGITGYDYNSAGSTKTGSATLAADAETKTVELINKYTKKAAPTGTLVIKKTIKGDITPDEFEGALKFKVTEPDGVTIREYTLKTGEFEKQTDGSYMLTIPNAKVGTYTVEETTTDITGKTYTVKYTIGSASGTSKTSNPVVSDGVTTTVNYEDNYVADKGILKIKKTIKGDITPDEFEGALKFKVTEPDGVTSKEYTLKTGEFVKQTDGSYVLTINDAKVGNYTIEETTTDITGKTYTAKYTVGGTTTDGKQATAAVIKNNTTEVEFEDNYSEITTPTGKLVIEKTIKGEITADEFEGALTFRVTGPGLDKTYTLTSPEFSKVGDKYILTLDNISVGDYTVVETTKDFEGRDVSVTYAVNGGAASAGKSAAVSVAQDSTTNVAFDDTYTKQSEIPKTGKLIIKKTIQGDVTKEEAEGALRFTVTKEGEAAVEYTLKDFKYDTILGIYTLELPAGKYTVKETIYDVNGYETVSATYKVNGSAEVQDAKTLAATVDATTVTATVEFDDSYKKKDEATTSAEATTAADATTAAEATTSSDKTTTEDDKNKASDKKTTEEKTSDKDKKTTEESKSKNTTEESESKKNDDKKKNAKGNLVITVFDEKTGDVVPGAKVEVINPDGTKKTYTTDDYGKVTIKNTAPGDYTVAVTDVPKGYTVTTNKKVTLTVKKNKTSSATIKIDKDGKVSVKKKDSSPKTGDDAPLVPVAITFVASLLGFALLFLKKKK